MNRKIATLGFALATALFSQGCQAPAGAGDESMDEAELDSGKADGSGVRLRVRRSGTEFAALNQGLDEWVHGIFDVSREADGSTYTVLGPWYKVRPDNSTGLWWRMDIRKAQGEGRVIGMQDREVAFFALQRFVGETTWNHARPEVTCVDGKKYTPGAYTSFRAGDGSLQAKLPGIPGTCTSDYFWNDTQPEFAFVPIPLPTAGSLAGGLGQFEISITEEE